jgi:hypothetical protein
MSAAQGYQYLWVRVPLNHNSLLMLLLGNASYLSVLLFCACLCYCNLAMLGSKFSTVQTIVRRPCSGMMG